MKYPKLWNGSSAVGEALVRALQMTGVPYLSARTADGVYAGVMDGKAEVKQERPENYVCLVWDESLYNEADPDNSTLLRVVVVLDYTTLAEVRREYLGPTTFDEDFGVFFSWNSGVVLDRRGRARFIHNASGTTAGSNEYADRLVAPDYAPVLLFDTSDIPNIGAYKGMRAVRAYKNALFCSEFADIDPTTFSHKAYIARWLPKDATLVAGVPTIHAAAQRKETTHNPKTGYQHQWLSVTPWGIGTQINRAFVEWYDHDKAHTFPRLGEFRGNKSDGFHYVVDTWVCRDEVVLLTDRYASSTSGELTGRFILFRERDGDAAKTMPFGSDRIDVFDAVGRVIRITVRDKDVLAWFVTPANGYTAGAAIALRRYSRKTGELVAEKEIPLRRLAADGGIAPGQPEPLEALYLYEMFPVWQ